MESPPDPPPLIRPGQLNVGLLADLRGPACGPQASLPACLMLSAALWSLFRSNASKSPRQFNVGLYAYDTCGDLPLAQRQVFRLVENVGHVQPTLCLEQRIPPVFGIVARGQDDVIRAAAQTIGAFHIPLLANLPGAFSTGPSRRALAKGVATFLSQVGWWTATLDPDSAPDLARIFRDEAASLGIELQSSSEPRVYIVFLNATLSTSQLATLKEVGNIPVIVASLELPAPKIQFEKPEKALVASPLIHPPDQGFLDFLQSAEDAGNHSSLTLGSLTESLCPELLNNQTVFEALSDATVRYDIESLVKSVNILVDVLRVIEARSCKSGVNCLPMLKPSLQRDIIQVMRQQSAASSADSSLNFRFDADGHLTTARVGFTLSSASLASKRILKKIGWYSEDSGLLLDLDKLSQSGFWVKGQSVPSNPSHWRTGVKSGRSFEHTTEAYVARMNETTVTMSPASLVSWMSKPWVLAILVLAILGILVTFYIAVFLLVKVCERALKRTNHFLNFTLLISLLLIQMGAALFLFRNTPLLCLLQRLFHNLAYIFTFACLLLRGMDLHAKKYLGLGGRSSRLNQLLTLMFVISVQVALEVQWVFLIKGPHSADFRKELSCDMFKYDFLFSQIYIIVILFMATVLSYWTRYVPYCHKEGQNLFITTSLVTLVFITRLAVYSVLEGGEEPKEICSSMGMILTTFVIIGGIYFPQLYKIHKNGGLSHKPLSYTDSFSSVFTLFKEIDSVSGESSSSLKRSRKPPKTLESPYCKGMVELKRGSRAFARTPSFKEL